MWNRDKCNGAVWTNSLSTANAELYTENAWIIHCNLQGIEMAYYLSKKQRPHSSCNSTWAGKFSYRQQSCSLSVRLIHPGQEGAHQHNAQQWWDHAFGHGSLVHAQRAENRIWQQAVQQARHALLIVHQHQVQNR